MLGRLFLLYTPPVVGRFEPIVGDFVGFVERLRDLVGHPLGGWML